MSHLPPVPKASCPHSPATTLLKCAPPADQLPEHQYMANASIFACHSVHCSSVRDDHVPESFPHRTGTPLRSHALYHPRCRLTTFPLVSQSGWPVSPSETGVARVPAGIPQETPIPCWHAQSSRGSHQVCLPRCPRYLRAGCLHPAAALAAHSDNQESPSLAPKW